MLIVVAVSCTGRGGLPLGEAEVIDNPVPAGGGEPNLSAAADGSVLLTWIESAGGGASRVRLSSYGSRGWTEPRTVAESRDLFVNWADLPSALRLPGGRIVAHYLERDPAARGAEQYGIRITTSDDDGATWSAPISPYQATPAAAYGFVSLFPADEGGAGVVWLDGRNAGATGDAAGDIDLRFAVLGADGAVQDEVVVDPRVCDCCQTAVAITQNGPIVAFRDRSPEEIRDIAVRRIGDAGGTPAVPVHLDGWRIGACPVNGPAIDAHGNRVAVAWFTAAADTPMVRIAFSDDSGASFSPPLRVDSGDPIGRVDLAMLDDGSAVVAWLERIGPLDAAVLYRRIAADGRLSATRNVGTMRARAGSGFPRMAPGADGILLAWTESAPSRAVRTALIPYAAIR